MFSNSEEDNIDFCDAYKSQILSNNIEEESSSLFSIIIKLMIILLLFVAIGAISFYGYHNFMEKNSSNGMSLPPQSTQISDDDLMVTLEEPARQEEHINNKKEKNIEEVANSVKIAIAKSESKEEVSSKETSKQEAVQEKLEVPISVPEAKYLEDLAILSDEIDKERN